MKRIGWLMIGCVAVAGMVLAFAAGVWFVKPAGDKTADKPVDATPTTAKPTPTVPPPTQKGDYQALSHKPDIPGIPVHPVIDTPKVPVEVPKPVGVAALPAVAPGPLPPPVGVAPPPTIEPAPLPVPIIPVEARQSAPPSEPLIPPIPPIVSVSESTPPSGSATKGPAVQYVNKSEVEFEYDIGKKGKSGVQSVTLFVRDTTAKDDKPTPQKGEPMTPVRPWAAELPIVMKDDINPKLRYTLPKDGRYEFRVGMTSRNGNASTPKDTEPADMVVVLDTKPPEIPRFEAAVDPATNSVGFRLELVEINLDNTRPAVIEYRNLAASGQWQVVRLKEMVWPIPADAPAEVTFRVTVTDLAGNVTTKVIDRLNLDTTIPEGKLTRVRAVEPPKKEEPHVKKEETPLPSPLPPPYPTLDVTPKK